MLELFTRTRWDQAQDFLLSGDPPMYARLIALNAFFVVWCLIRRFKGAKPLPPFGLFAVKCLLLVANLLLMLQKDITNALGRLI